eukprot:scaffold164153_cov29-Tisochrysis_lutea.AAC.7
MAVVDSPSEEVRKELDEIPAARSEVLWKCVVSCVNVLAPSLKEGVHSSRATSRARGAGPTPPENGKELTPYSHKSVHTIFTYSHHPIASSERRPHTPKGRETVHTIFTPYLASSGHTASKAAR